MFKQVAAENFINGAVAKRQPPFGVADKIHSVGSLSVDAEVSRALDASGAQVDLHWPTIHATNDNMQHARNRRELNGMGDVFHV